MTEAVLHLPQREDEGLRPSPFQRRLGETDLQELRDVLDASRRLLGADAAPPVEDIVDYSAASGALDVTWQAICAALTGSARARDVVLESSGISDLLVRVRRVDTVLRDKENRRRHDALNAVRSALARFQSVESMSRLISLAPEVVCSLGFDRAIISRIQDSVWVTEAVHVSGDAEWADAIQQIGHDNPQPLGPTIRETEIVRRRKPMLVTDVQHDRNVHRAVADASLSRSYVAAPIVLRANVVGFLHADRYFHRGDTDAFDRDMLALFSEGLSYAMERTLLIGRLDEMRDDVRRIVGGIDAVVSRPAGTLADAFAVADLGPGSAPPPTSFSGLEHDTAVNAARLTRRELDVVRLMARGETNTRIATRLVLSEATVKSHVKHILRKLGAGNRAEAVSKWLLAAGHPDPLR